MPSAISIETNRLPSLFRYSTQLMTTRDVTPPTLMSIPPPIMTTVRPQATIISGALSFSRSKICCARRKPPPSSSMARAYIAKKIQIVMVISSWVSVSGSLRLLTGEGF